MRLPSRRLELNASVVVVAAGKGRRFGGRRPKQFLPLAGKPLLYWSLQAMQRSPVVRSIVLVTSPAFVLWAREFLRKHKVSKARAVVPGGAERADSVREGVASCPGDASVILIHDAARPLVTPEIVGRVALAAFRRGAAVAAWPVPDTLKAGKKAGGGSAVRATVSREGLWLAQTPQGFRRDVADRLFRGRSREKMTDDVQLAERAGLPVELVPASPQNFKVTLPEDFRMAATLLSGRKR